MKKLFPLLFSLTFTFANLYSQDIIFTFNSKYASTIIDSIRATNVETGETTLIVGSNTINLSSFSTGTEIIQSNFESISIFPNPFDDRTELQFYSNKKDNVKIQLINASNQIVAVQNQSITPGFHSFNIFTKTQGIYFVNVIGSTNKFSKKIISINKNQNSNNIQYKGFVGGSQIEKSANAADGEVVHFMVYSGGNITKIADSLIESKTYEVEFYECKDADGKSYPIVQIGDQWWMAENLAYETENGSVTCNNVEYNTELYGRLYTWEAAIAACPSGWHLPTDEEWQQLEMTIGMGESEVDGIDWRGTNEGTKLKTTSGWDNNGNGTDNFGFSALPGGYCNTVGNCYFIGTSGYWWSATRDLGNDVWLRHLYESSTGIYRKSVNIGNGRSVRCVMD